MADTNQVTSFPSKPNDDLTDALYQDGLKFKNAKDYASAFPQFEQAVARNHVNATFELALLYDHGRGVPKDYQKARELYELAATHDHSRAINNLAFMYEFGDGVEQNYVQARQLYERAVDLKDCRSMFHLADIYYEGKGVPKDYIRARELYELALKHGETEAADAFEGLAKIYGKGRGVPRDPVNAEYYYQQWLRHDKDPYNYMIVAQEYVIGRFFPKNLTRAIDLSIQGSHLLTTSEEKDQYTRDIDWILKQSQCVKELFYYCSSLARRVETLEQDKRHLEQEIEALKLEISYAPGGFGFQEAQEHFNTLVDQHP
jgi:TPR repeat protein